MSDETAAHAIWVLGATGRTGREIAFRLSEQGFDLVLAGRDRARLEAVAATLPRHPRVVVGTLDENLAELRSSDAAVVVSTVGPFVDTAERVYAALPAGAHYVDINNEYDVIRAALDRHEQFVAEGRTVVSASGFGVLAIEAIARKLMEGRPPAARVRVDAAASVAGDGGRMGDALAGTITDGFRVGGLRVSGGELVKDNPASAPLTLTTPDGDTLRTGSFPSGELLTAWRATGAPEVICGSTAMGLGTGARAVIPVAAFVMRNAGLRRWLTGRLASMTLKAAPAPRAHSWSHARIEWSDGTVREGWLRLAEGMNVTADVAAAVAAKLARGLGKPGAYTPAELFGPELAEELGGAFVL